MSAPVIKDKLAANLRAKVDQELRNSILARRSTQGTNMLSSWLQTLNLKVDRDYELVWKLLELREHTSLHLDAEFYRNWEPYIKSNKVYYICSTLDNYRFSTK